MDADTLRQYLEFYQDLGIKTLYRSRPASSAGTGCIVAAPEPITWNSLPSLRPTTRSSKSSRTSAIATAADSATRRNKIVFGVGNEKAQLVFVGEGPGADEDAQGIPFVGRAGQLLTQMIENTAKKEGIPLKRDDVYICNVVKCRPPGESHP